MATSFQQAPSHIAYNQWVTLHLTFTAQVCRYIQSKRGCIINIPMPMWILAKCRHEWLSGQEGPRSSQTAHLALEAPFFDHQVASSLRLTLPLWSSIPPGSLQRRLGGLVCSSIRVVCSSLWVVCSSVLCRLKLTLLALSPKARCMRKMYLNYLA